MLTGFENQLAIRGPTEQLGGLFHARTRKLPVPFQITRNFRDSAVPRNTVTRPKYALKDAKNMQTFYS